jgi:hypothetical protein
MGFPCGKLSSSEENYGFTTFYISTIYEKFRFCLFTGD